MKPQNRPTIFKPWQDMLIKRYYSTVSRGALAIRVGMKPKQVANRANYLGIVKLWNAKAKPYSDKLLSSVFR